MKYNVDYSERSKDDPDYLPIDFTLRDDQDEPVAFVYGSAPDNVMIECEHEVEWGDEEEVGVCPICGADCLWHYETEWEDTGHDANGDCTGYEIRTRKIDTWSTPLVHNSIIGELLKEGGEDDNQEM